MTVRTLAVVACALLLAACDGGASTSADPLADTGRCAPLERPQLQEGGHLLGETAPPVPYSSDPPTSGWHASGRPLDAGTYLEPVPGPQQVRVLEQGGVVVSYDPTLPDDRVAALQLLPDEVEAVVTAWPDATSPVVLTAWGVRQACDDVTAEDVAAFRDAHAIPPGHD